MAEAGCRYGPQIATVLLQQYLTTPAILLFNNRQGTDGLRVTVQRLAITGPDAVKAILSTTGDASPAQQAAIGAGLAEAARACMTQDSGIVQRIKNAVRSSGSSAVEKSFMAKFENDAQDDAGSSSLSPGGTPRLAARPAAALPQSLLPVDPASAGKIPDPFGAPEEWR